MWGMTIWHFGSAGIVLQLSKMVPNVQDVATHREIERKKGVHAIILPEGGSLVLRRPCCRAGALSPLNGSPQLLVRLTLCRCRIPASCKGIMSTIQISAQILTRCPQLHCSATHVNALGARTDAVVWACEHDCSGPLHQVRVQMACLLIPCHVYDPLHYIKA